NSNYINAFRWTRNLLTASLILFAGLFVNAQTYNFVPVPDFVQADVGDNFSVIIRLEPNGAAQVSNVDVIMAFDPNVVHITSINSAPGNLLPILFSPPNIDNVGGGFSIAY